MKNLFLLIISLSLFGCSSNNDDLTQKHNDTASYKISQSVLRSMQLDSSIKYETNKNKSNVIINPQIEKRLTQLKKKKDDFKEVTFYNSKTEPRGFSNSIYLYIVENKGQCTERLVISYTASEWLFVDHYEFIVDGKKFVIIPEQVTRDNAAGDVIELSDDFLSPENKQTIKAIIDSKESKMRYIGKDYYHDRVISAREKKSLNDIYSILFN